MSAGLIFDLDMTLVDSSIADLHRSRRDWPEVYKLIPSFKLFPDIKTMFKVIDELECKVAIVTSSPATYCQRVLDHFEIKIHARVCYHDTQRRKPHPDPILRAVDLLELNAEECISFGDTVDDITASQAAGVTACGCLWGSKNPELLRSSKADELIESVYDCIDFIVDTLGYDDQTF